MRFCLWCYRQCGARTLNALLYPIIGWFFLLGGSARQASMQYLERVLQRPASYGESFRHFLAFGRAIVDKLGAWNGEIRHKNVTFHQRQLLLDQKASGKGCVILTSHLGNTDVCRALSGYVEGLHLNILLFTRHAQQINRVLQDVNPDAGMEIIQIDTIGPDTAIQLHDKIQRGEFVVIAADRTSPTAMHRVSSADFLGQPALFPQGPFILSGLLECPVYLLFALRNDHGKNNNHADRQGQYEIFVEPFANRLSFPRRQREVLLAETVQRYADRLQHYCRLAPLQWFNFFDFWQSARQQTAPAVQPRLSDD